jgi:hypothetical protein
VGGDKSDLPFYPYQLEVSRVPSAYNKKLPNSWKHNAFTKKMTKIAMICTFDPYKPNEAFLQSTFKALIITITFLKRIWQPYFSPEIS